MQVANLKENEEYIVNQYTIVRRTENHDWNTVPMLSMLEQLHPRYVHQVKAWAQVCYDDEALYVRLTAEEPFIRAELNGPLDEICEDSCLEFFFCPIENDDRYFNFEVNPNGAMYKGIGTNVRNLQRLIPENAFIVPTITMTEDGWVAEYAIPYTFVRLFFPDFSPAPGKSIRANCYKCGNHTVAPHWLCWCKVSEELSTFHCPAYFGTMTFA